MLELSNFIKSYGTNVVLDIKNALFSPGNYWIRGSNGSGKSSLLRSIAGATNFKGNLTMDRLSLKSDGSRYRKTVNFAEAEPVYPEFLSGMELIGFFEASKGRSIFSIDRMLADMQMEGYVRSPLGTYSSGMLKKLSLVLAFVGQPRWILLDEPLNTLDHDSVAVLYDWISSAHVELGISFMLSSHQQLELTLLPETQIATIVNNNLVMP